MLPSNDHLSGEGTYLVGSIRGERRKRQQVRIGAADRALTANAGLAAVSELCRRLGVIGRWMPRSVPSSSGTAVPGPGGC